MDRRKLTLVLLALLSLLALARFVVGGIWWPLTNGSWEQLRAEELPPLLNYVLKGIPITSVDPRQYGVVTFLVVHPLLVIAGGDMRAVEVALLAIADLAVLGSLLLVWLRLYGRHDLQGLVVLGILWYTFTPIYYILAIKNVDAWQLFFLALAFFLFTSNDPRVRPWAGLPVAFGAMTKLLPFVVLAFLALRDRRAFLVGVVGVGALVAVGQALYGPLMGLQYLPNIFVSTMQLTDWTAPWYENDAIRGFVYKIAAGFRLANTYFLDMSEQSERAARLISYVLSIPVIAYFAFVAWRGRASADPRRRAIEFSIAILVMLLVSPSTPHEFMLLALPAYATAVRLFQIGIPRPWPKLATGSLGLSIALVGTIVPLSVVTTVLPITRLRDLVGAERLDPGEFYRFFLFPGIGLFLLCGLMVWLEMTTRRPFAWTRIAATPMRGTERTGAASVRRSPAI